MKPYGQHKGYKGCHCSQCRQNKHLKAKKTSERQRAKKEIRNELSKVVKKEDV